MTRVLDGKAEHREIDYDEEGSRGLMQPIIPKQWRVLCFVRESV